MIDEDLQKNSKHVYVSVSLGQLRYLSAMQLCDVVIGNSSSGIVEAPAIKKPTVNIGKRQSGRLKARSIIDCDVNEESIVNAINKALSSEFKQEVVKTESLYGDCNASSKIKYFLKHTNLNKETNKSFFDLNFG
jgi:UDP-N-acetylglucosamine 2-epimerase